MAGHALTPATRHSLGRPLPHQRADRSRADPRPQKLCPACHAGRRGHPVLATVSRCYPRVRGTLPTCYSPVRRFQGEGLPLLLSSLDLHVLSTPPAFVLSQDQTLRRDSIQVRTLRIEDSKAFAGFIHVVLPPKAEAQACFRFGFDEVFTGLRSTPSERASRQAHCSVLKERATPPGATKNAGRGAPASQRSWVFLAQVPISDSPSLSRSPIPGTCQRSIRLVRYRLRYHGTHGGGKPAHQNFCRVPGRPQRSSNGAYSPRQRRGGRGRATVGSPGPGDRLSRPTGRSDACPPARLRR